MAVATHEPRKRVSPFTIVGVLLLVVGLSCLGWVGYQIFGTNIVSERAFDTETAELRTQWDQESVGPGNQESAKTRDRRGHRADRPRR